MSERDPLLAQLDNKSRGVGKSDTPFWKPVDAGDQLVGELESVSTGYAAYGETPVLNVRDESDGEVVACWMFGKVLRAEVEDARPQPGKRVAIRFLGHQMSGSGNKYGLFRVVAEEKLAGNGDYFEAALRWVDPADEEMF